MIELLTVALQEQTYEEPGPLFWVLYFAFVIAVVAAFWRVFTKAGEPGWAVLVPFYNIIVLLKIIGRPWWWLVLQRRSQALDHLLRRPVLQGIR